MTRATDRLFTATAQQWFKSATAPNRTATPTRTYSRPSAWLRAWSLRRPRSDRSPNPSKRSVHRKEVRRPPPADLFFLGWFHLARVARFNTGETAIAVHSVRPRAVGMPRSFRPAAISRHSAIIEGNVTRTVLVAHTNPVKTGKTVVEKQGRFFLIV